MAKINGFLTICFISWIVVYYRGEWNAGLLCNKAQASLNECHSKPASRRALCILSIFRSLLCYLYLPGSGGRITLTKFDICWRFVSAYRFCAVQKTPQGVFCFPTCPVKKKLFLISDFEISQSKNFSGASRRRLENNDDEWVAHEEKIVFLTDEREENFQQKIILVTEKFLDCEILF